jgi:hypothetical protein
VDFGPLSSTKPLDTLFNTMRNYIADIECSSGKKERLTALVRETELGWRRIMSEPETPDSSVPSAQYQIPEPERSGSSPMSVLVEDLNLAFIDSNFSVDESGRMVYHLHQDYVFKANLGRKVPIRNPVAASIKVSAAPERTFIKYPGFRCFGVHVGFCPQYDSNVYFGENGRIYLVEQASEVSLCMSDGAKMFDADELLESDWRTLR